MHVDGWILNRSPLFTLSSVSVVVSLSLPWRPLPPSTTARSPSAASATYVHLPNLPHNTQYTHTLIFTGPPTPPCHQLPQAQVRTHQPAPPQEEAQINDSPLFFYFLPIPLASSNNQTLVFSASFLLASFHKFTGGSKCGIFTNILQVTNYASKKFKVKWEEICRNDPFYFS